MKTIYFIRHGSTEGTEKNCYQQPTISLSQKGVEEAFVVATRLAGLPAELVITSDMTRAQMTAQEILKKIKVPLVVEPLFREIMRPTVVRGRSQNDPDVEAIMNEIKKNYDNPTWHHSDEENFFDLKARAREALDFLAKREEKVIFVVTHGHFLRMMLSYMQMGEDTTAHIYKNTLKTFYIAPTGVSIAKTFEGKLSVHTWNDYSHLESH